MRPKAGRIGRHGWGQISKCKKITGIEWVRDYDAVFCGLVGSEDPKIRDNVSLISYSFLLSLYIVIHAFHSFIYICFFFFFSFLNTGQIIIEHNIVNPVVLCILF